MFSKSKSNPFFFTLRLTIFVHLIANLLFKLNSCERCVHSTFLLSPLDSKHMDQDVNTGDWTKSIVYDQLEESMREKLMRERKLTAHDLKKLNISTIFYLSSEYVKINSHLVDLMMEYPDQLPIAAKVGGLISKVNVKDQKTLMSEVLHTISQRASKKSSVDAALSEASLEMLSYKLSAEKISSLNAEIEDESRDSILKLISENAPILLVHLPVSTIFSLTEYDFSHNGVGDALFSIRSKFGWDSVGSGELRRIWFRIVKSLESEGVLALNNPEAEKAFITAVNQSQLELIHVESTISEEILSYFIDDLSLLDQAQVQVISSKIDWKDSNMNQKKMMLRRKIIPYLGVDQLSDELDFDFQNLRHSSLPYISFLKLTRVMENRNKNLSPGGDPTRSPAIMDGLSRKKFMSKLLKSVSEHDMHNTLDEIQADIRIPIHTKENSQAKNSPTSLIVETLNIVADKLNRAQKEIALNKLIQLYYSRRDSTSGLLQIPTFLSEAIATPMIFQHNDWELLVPFQKDGDHVTLKDDQKWKVLIQNFNRLTKSQQISVFLNSIDFMDSSNRQRLAKVMEQFLRNPSEVMKFVSPTEFKAMLKMEFFTETIFNPDSGYKLSELPDFHKEALLEYYSDILTPQKMVTIPAFVDVLDVLSCSHLAKHVDLHDTTTTLSKYNQRLLQNDKNPPYSQELLSQTMPLSLRQCFKERLLKGLCLRAEHRNQDFQLHNSTRLMNGVRPDWIRLIGGHILSSFSVEEMRVIKNGDVLEEVIRSVGKLSMHQIMAYMSDNQFRQLSDWGVQVLMDLDKVTSLKYPQLSMLGSLVFGSINALKLVEMEDFRLFLSNWKGGMVCTPNIYRSDVRDLILQIFGRKVEFWDEQTVLLLGDHLLNLDEVDWYKIQPKVIVRVLPHILRESFVKKRYRSEVVHSWSKNLVDVCADWLEEDEGLYFQLHVKAFTRFLLKSAQLSVNAIQESKLVNKRSLNPDDSNNDELIDSMSLHLDDLSKTLHILRGKVQTSRRLKRDLHSKNDAGKEDIVLRKEVKDTVQIRLVKMKQNNPELVTDISKYITNMKIGEAAFMQKHFNLSEQPSPQRLHETMENLIKSGEYSDAQIEVMNKHMDSASLHLIQHIVKKLKLTPLDLDITRQEFCNTFPVRCKDLKLDGEVIESDRRKDIIDANPPRSESDDDNIDWSSLSFEDVSGISVNGLLAADFAASSVRKADLKSWTFGDMHKYLDVLGDIKYLDVERKVEIWGSVKNVAFQERKKLDNAGYITYLNELIEGTISANDSMQYLNLSVYNVDVISIAGKFTNSLPETLVALYNQIESDSNLRLPVEDTTQNIVIFGSMGRIICGISADRLKLVFNFADLPPTLIPILGSSLINCPNHAALEVFAQNAIKIYGSVSRWTPSIVKSLGIIVAGLDAVEMSKLNGPSLHAITPQTAIHMTLTQIEKLSVTQVKSMNGETLSRLVIFHLLLDQKSRIADEKYFTLQEIDEKVMSSSSLLSETLKHFASVTGVMKDETRKPKVARASSSYATQIHLAATKQREGEPSGVLKCGKLLNVGSTELTLAIFFIFSISRYVFQ